MTLDDSGHFDPAHLQRWWQATLVYMSSASTSEPDAADPPQSTLRSMAVDASTDRVEAKAPLSRAFSIGSAGPQSSEASHGRQRRLISRVRGSLLWSMDSAARGEQEPLRELERVFHLQIGFIARHPDIPARLLGWRAHDDSAHIRRRVQKLIDLQVSRLSRVIDRARQQGLVGAETEPHAAAWLLVGITQGLAIGIELRPDRPDILLARADSVFAAYRAQLAGPAR